MPRTDTITTVAALAALASASLATASFTTTYYSDIASWSSAVGGSNECTWDFDPIGTPVVNGWGSFTDQYADFGVRAPGQFGASGATYPGLPYTQIGMSPETAWVYPQLGLSSGLAATGWKPLTFDAPTRGLAFHLVGAPAWATFFVRLYQGDVFLGQTGVSFGAAPAYGSPPPTAGLTSVLVALTVDVDFDYVEFESSSFKASFGVESLWVPTSAIPSPGVLPALALVALAGRRRR
jgi:MYXO-CTERM domain-containing protein